LTRIRNFGGYSNELARRDSVCGAQAVEDVNGGGEEAERVRLMQKRKRDLYMVQYDKNTQRNLCYDQDDF
jgi:hypothetical protein